MVSQRPYDVGGPVTSGRTRRRRRPGLLESLLRNPMVCGIVVAAVLCSCVALYVSAYAGAFERGTMKSDLQRHLGDVRRENDKLALQLSELRKADQISKAAADLGMTQTDRMAYVTPEEHPAVAQNVR